MRLKCNELGPNIKREGTRFDQCVISNLVLPIPCHSDSLLTAATFFKLRQLYFDNAIDDNKYLGVLYGLGVPYSVTANEAGNDSPHNTV